MTYTEKDQQIAAIAAGQASAFSRAQAASVGLNHRHLKARVEAGRLLLASPRVLLVAGHPDTAARRLWIAHLDAGPESWVSHEAAAHGLRFPTFDTLEEVAVTRPHGRAHRSQVATVHQSRNVTAPFYVDDLPGLPLSSPERCVIELASRLSPSRLDHVVSELVHRRRVLPARLHRLFFELHGLLMPGGPTLLRILDSCLTGDELSGTALELLLRQALAGVPGPPPLFEAAFPGREAFGNRVDALLMPERIIVEADGRAWHTRKDDFSRDRARDRDALRAGYVTLRYSHQELKGDPDGVRADVTYFRQERRPGGSLHWAA